jgi:RimJ/RimL family protein N-acetyltransferase
MVAAAEAEGVRIRASVDPTNKASLRVLAKAGFTVLRGANDEGHLVMVRPLGPSARPAPSAQIRSTTEDDWERLRDFRLENAREHPISYGATEETVLDFTEDDWRMRARRGDQDDAACFTALDPSTGRWIGMMQGLPADEYGGSPVLTGVYVTKHFRRHGVADALLEPVLAWAAERDTELRLWVFEGSDPARRFYVRHGFSDTGRTRPLDLDPALGNLIEMRRQL